MAESSKQKRNFSLEVIINRWVQKLLPVWYASQACREVELQPIGRLNPPSFLQSYWIDVENVVQDMKSSLAGDDKRWSKLAGLLDELFVTRHINRNLDVELIHGVNFSQHKTNYSNLLAYAQSHSQDIAIEKNQDFDNNLALCFPEDKRPINVVYREWDGRYAWMNEEEPTYLGALILQNSQGNRRDTAIPAEVEVKGFKNAAIDDIISHYWVLVLHQNSLELLDELFDPAGFERKSLSLSIVNPQLRLLVASKKDKAFNRAIFNLLLSHSTHQVVDFFRYLQRIYKPFK